MSNRNLNKIIVCDLELTCWANEEEQGSQVSEIIEIGLCFLNLKTMLPENKVSYLVRPKTSTISQYCINLTSITPELIASEGIPFIDAINKLKKEFGPKYKTWGSWGAMDRVALEKNCQRNEVPYPMGRNHINIKNLYSLRFGLPKELGMMKALNHSGINHEGTHHRGDDDAWNTAKLMAKILRG